MTVAEALAAAVEHHQSGRLSEAETLYRQIIAVEPQHADALHLLGVLAHETGHHEAAALLVGRAIALNGEVARYHNSLGNALRAMKRAPEAMRSYDRAIQVGPEFAEAHFDRGVLLEKLKRYDESLASYDCALALRPDFAEAHSNRGNILLAQGRYDEALASYDRAVGLQPGYAIAYYNRGIAFHALGRYADALASYDRAIDLQPDFAEAFSNRGNALRELARYEEALASYGRAIAGRSDYADAHFHEAFCRLVIGDFDRGWQKLEWRWETEQQRNSKRSFKQPLWLGQNEIAGRTILLHAEQGFGDTIQFCRYVPLVAERGARVILEVKEPLKELMTSLAGTAQVVAAGSALPDFDVQCPLLSLPLAFGTRLKTIPSAVPYLRAASSRVIDWDARLGPKKRHPRIGLAWSGSPIHFDDRKRSIQLRALLSLLDSDATFVSLQKDVRPEDAVMLNKRCDLLHFGDALTDFSETAALIANLDLVISVDTSVVHLAGALAKPVWILLPFTPDWRWLLDRLDSPWYPTARLFRQDGTRAWETVIARVHEALSNFIQMPMAISGGPRLE